MNVTKSWIYKNDDANQYRYLLGESGSRMLACFGVNPSIAVPEKLDPTLKSVKRISENSGFDGWVMYNLYPKRATDPALLPKRCKMEQHQKNYELIQQSFELLNIKAIWLAYGNLIESRTYLMPCGIDIFKLLLTRKLQWKILPNLTKKGHPRHPLYQRADSILKEFVPREHFKDFLR